MRCQILFVVFTLCSVNAEQRIAGGSPVELEKYPFSVSLLTNRGSGTVFTQACGGSILTRNAVLSAASCFHTDGVLDQLHWWRARVGSVFSTRGGTLHLFRRITPHPGFSPTTRANDIAVLRTNIDMTLSPNVAQPALVAGAGLTLTTHQQIMAIGWGLTADGSEPSEQLREVQFFVIDQEVCRSRYAQLGFQLTDNMVCTGWLDVGVFAQCEGDAGSPILVDGVIVGVHSWAEGCADGWYSGINTRIAPYTSWVVSTALAA